MEATWLVCRQSTANLLRKIPAKSITFGSLAAAPAMAAAAVDFADRKTWLMQNNMVCNGRHTGVNLRRQEGNSGYHGRDTCPVCLRSWISLAQGSFSKPVICKYST
jgi:hypothetical protein